MNRKPTFPALVVVAALGLALAAAGCGGAEPQTQITYPEGYRNWAHVKSMVIHDPAHPLYEAFGGIHHVYVNPRGAETLRRGSGTYPDGSVFVFDLLEANLDGGAYVEGDRKVLAMMVKNAGRYGSTGGWGFEAFAGGDPAQRVVVDAAKDCFNCHAPQQATDYVFSGWRK
jgi:hypothetical protein